MITQGTAHPTQPMDWSRVKPSLGDHCPRKNCGLTMTQYQVEHMRVWRCICNYEVRETSTEARRAFQEQWIEIEVASR